MSLPALMTGLDLPAPLEADIQRLIELKQAGAEADTAAVPDTVAGFLEAALLNPAPRPAPWDRTTATKHANDLFRQILDSCTAA